MFEVCFDDSTKCGLILAQKCGDNIVDSNGPVCFFTNSQGIASYIEKRKAKKLYKSRMEYIRKNAVPLGGKPENVLGISFALSQGDIKAPVVINDCPRKEYIYSQFSFDRYNEKENIKQDFENFWEKCIDDLEKLKTHPDEIRIWLDKTPDAQCGLLFVADLLKNSETKIHIVDLPEKLERGDDCCVEYRGWGDVEPELFGSFLNRERILSKDEIIRLSQQWNNLKEKNAPLRVFKDGVVISTDESYYDNLIRQEFPENSCKVGYLIGSALGRHNIFTGDVFIAKRIQYFIKAGELTVIDDANGSFYDSVISADSLSQVKIR